MKYKMKGVTLLSSILKEKEYTEEKLDVGLWKKLFTILWEHKKMVINLILFNILIAVTDVIFPLLNRSAINDFAIHKGVNTNLMTFSIVYCF